MREAEEDVENKQDTEERNLALNLSKINLNAQQYSRIQEETKYKGMIKNFIAILIN